MTLPSGDGKGVAMIQLEQNAYLLRQGEEPSCGYLIERGSVEVVVEHDGRERLLAILGEGEIVGEMALIDRAPRSASVRAREHCLLLPITADSLEKRLATADPVLRLVLSTILDRFRGMIRARSGAPQNPAEPFLRTAVRTSANAELRLEKEFAQALDEGQVGVHYQPIVRLSDGCLAGFEALSRWTHPIRGLIPPTIFVPVAEASGLSARLTRTCLTQVVRDMAALRTQATARPAHVLEPRVSVNISGHDLTSPGFIDELAAIISDHGESIAIITLELTETTLVHKPDEAAAALQRARALGFKIAVDDFGTGYSSLSYIRTLPVDVLKIDKSFIQGMIDCATTHSIVASTLKLATSLGLAVVAEGVELVDQHGVLQMLGCDFGQGYLLGRPLPLAQTLSLIKSWQHTAAPAPLTFGLTA